MKTATNPNPAETIAKLIHRLIREITTEPDKIKITGHPVGRSYFFEVLPTRADMPKLVGEHGKTVRAFKALVQLFGRRHGVEMQYNVLEPEQGKSAPLQPFRRQEKWNSKPVEALALELANAILIHPPVKVTVTNLANYVSVLTVVASDDEQLALIQAFREPFAVIFNAVGKTHGRVLQPDVVSQMELKHQSATFAPVNIG